MDVLSDFGLEWHVMLLFVSRHLGNLVIFFTSLPHIKVQEAAS